MNFIKSKESKKAITYILFVLPALFIYLLIIGYPILRSLYLSFCDYNVVGNQVEGWVGLKWYIKMFKHKVFWWDMRNTFIVVFISVFGQIPLGLVLAYILYRKLVRFQGFFQGVVFLPITLSMIVVGILWNKMFSAVGVITGVLRVIHNDPQYTISMLTDKTWAMLPVAFVLLWLYTGFYMIFFLANLQKIDPSIIEAAMIDGASEFQIFTKIIVPALTGTMVVLSIIAISGSFKGFDLIYGLTGGGPSNYTEVLTIYMYKYAFTFRPGKYDFACAISMVIVALCILLAILANYIKTKLAGREA